MTKTCNNCKRELDISCFIKRTDRKDLYRSHCRECCNKHTAIWQEKNKKRLAKLRKENYQQWAEEYRKDAREWRRKNPSQKLIQGAKERAEKHNLPFNISAEDVPIPSICPVLGIPLTPNIGGRIASDNSPSIDRIIPEKGYVKGNVLVISYRANTIKNAGTIEEHLKIIEYMRRQL